MKQNDKFVDQVKKHSLAIISLIIAVIALTYNTWRASTSEINRNYRNAAFELVLQLGELQSITNDLHFNYPDNPSREWIQHYDKNLIEGWGHIALIEDLSALLSDEFETHSNELKAIWAQYHTKLGDRSSRSEQVISGKIKELRQSTREFIKQLD